MSSKVSGTLKSSKAPGYRCTECGWTTAKWVGRCGECQEWNTVVEASAGVSSGPKTQAAGILSAERSQPISAVDATLAQHQPTGIPEFDRVLGGGLIPGGVVLLAGEPGIGKSTLVLDAAAQFSRPDSAHPQGRPVLYITGEESAAQVRSRADRIGAVSDTLYLAPETDLAKALGQIQALDPALVILDSVQTVQSAAVEGTAGGVNQIREVASAITQVAKDRGIATILIGHVTKDGSIAGPRLLEHLVDVVLQFEGDRQSRLRMVRAVKNRYGSTDEVGCFDLDDAGINSVADISGLFATSTQQPTLGTANTLVMEGKRPLLTEIQALISRNTEGGSGRRTVSGLDTSRINMLLAVLIARCPSHPFSLESRDVYTSTVGGIKISEPAADLPTAAALLGASRETPITPGLVTFGEVGLTGDLRPVPAMQRRVNEAARLGFTRAVVPLMKDRVTPPTPEFLIYEASTLDEALRVIFSSS